MHLFRRRIQPRLVYSLVPALGLSSIRTVNITVEMQAVNPLTMEVLCPALLRIGICLEMIQIMNEGKTMLG